jgi:hypothetical protein
MSQHKSTNLQKFRPSSLIIGALFIAVAVCALLGQFNDVERSKTIFPVAAVIIGAVVVGSGVRRLLTRD